MVNYNHRPILITVCYMYWLSSKYIGYVNEGVEHKLVFTRLCKLVTSVFSQTRLIKEYATYSHDTLTCRLHFSSGVMWEKHFVFTCGQAKARRAFVSVSFGDKCRAFSLWMLVHFHNTLRMTWSAVINSFHHIVAPVVPDPWDPNKSQLFFLRIK